MHARAAPAQTRARASGRMPGGSSDRAPSLTKTGHEAFRFAKFGRPMHAADEDGRVGSMPASSQEGDEGDEGDTGADDEGNMAPDCSRVILHFDAGESIRAPAAACVPSLHGLTPARCCPSLRFGRLLLRPSRRAPRPIAAHEAARDQPKVPGGHVQLPSAQSGGDQAHEHRRGQEEMRAPPTPRCVPLSVPGGHAAAARRNAPCRPSSC